MSALSDLSPDQRAVLQLLLKQGKTYGELAALLRIDPAAVRERAALALDALAGEAGDGLGDAEVDRLADHLLGQGDAAPPAGTPQAVLWSAAVAGALRAGGLEPKGEVALELPGPAADAPSTSPFPGPAREPDLPSGPPQPTPPAAPAEPHQALPPRREPAAPDGAVPPPAPLPGFGAPDGDGAPRASRTGGILLLLGIVAVVAVVLVVVLTRGGDDDSTKDVATVSTQTAGADTATATAATATSTTPLQVEAQINMTPPSGSSKALGVATIITDGKTQAVQIQTQGLAANGKSDLYALWLTGGKGGKASLLGFQKTPVGKTGRFQGTATLPTDVADYTRIELSRETQNNPTKPTTVILRGALK